MRKAYTYFVDLGQDLDWLFELWIKTWSNHGWECHVISQEDAMRAGDIYERLEGAVKKYPSVNDNGNYGYKRACFIRHAAMISVGGGVLTDVDTLNFGFTPEDICRTDFHRLDGAANYVGEAAHYAMFCGMIIGAAPHAIDYTETINGMPHVEDMGFYNQLGLPITGQSKIVFYDKGWEDSKLIHFANCPTKGRRREVIDKFAMDRGITL